MVTELDPHATGSRLPGTNYVVVRRLGSGGMGSVLEVVREPGIRGAVKLLHPQLSRDPVLQARFFDEVRLLAALEHPNIVKVRDYDRLSDGTPYFAMELLVGSNLRQIMDRTGVIDGPHAFEIMVGLLAALEYAHTHSPQVVHGDVKGENIFVHVPAIGSACVKVIDFGLAGTGGASAGYDHVACTPRYAAPEVLRGARRTPQVDIYAAALVLYEALAGRGPFDDVPLLHEDMGDRTRAAARCHLSVEPPSIRTYAPRVPASIDRVLQAALAKDPTRRPPSAAAFASHLDPLRLLSTAPVHVGATSLTLETLAGLVETTTEREANSSAVTREVRLANPLKDTVKENAPLAAWPENPTVPYPVKRAPRRAVVATLKSNGSEAPGPIAFPSAAPVPPAPAVSALPSTHAPLSRGSWERLGGRVVGETPREFKEVQARIDAAASASAAAATSSRDARTEPPGKVRKQPPSPQVRADAPRQHRRATVAIAVAVLVLVLFACGVGALLALRRHASNASPSAQTAPARRLAAGSSVRQP